MRPKSSRLIVMNAALFMLALAGCQSQAPAASAPQMPERPNIQPATNPVVVEEAPVQREGQQQDKHREVEQRFFQLDELQRVKIKVDKHEFNAWVMDTEAKRQEGMMFLEDSDFKKTDCMVFVFREAIPLRFWMRNTLVPLDIAYVGDKKTILNTYTMKARDEVTDYSSKGDAMYAIEFKAGTFKELKIAKGMKVEIPDNVKEKEPTR